jgi:hypothetical protein
MGIFFTKNKKVYTEWPKSEMNNSDIKEIINKYEYIKNRKQITDIDKLIEVMKNTDWDKNNITNNLVEPSAPPLELDSTYIPIAIARVIEQK